MEEETERDEEHRMGYETDSCASPAFGGDGARGQERWHDMPLPLGAAGRGKRGVQNLAGSPAVPPSFNCAAPAYGECHRDGSTTTRAGDVKRA